MSKDSINEMEQIQKGLEEFLRQEVEGYSEDIRYDDRIDKEDNINRNYSKTRVSGRTVPDREQDRPVRKVPDREQDRLVRTVPDREQDRPVRKVPDREQDRPVRKVPDREQDRPVRQVPDREQDHPVRTVPDREQDHPERTVLDRKTGESERVVRTSRNHKRENTGMADTRRGQGSSVKFIPDQDADVAGRNAGKKKADTANQNKRNRKTASDRPNDADGELTMKKKKKVKVKSPEKSGAKKADNKKQGRKKSGFRKFLIVIVLLTVLIGAGWYTLVGSIYGKMKYEEITSLTNAPMKQDGVINILLIGNDSRSQGEDGRSDAMILLSVSSRTKTIHMTSLLRDIYVEIPGYKGNRLNAAYSFGGPELLMETIEKNLDISINRYVLVNFQAFANLVDAVGGVDLELSSKEVEYVNGYLVEYNILEGRPEGTDYLDTSLSGMIHLNGPQALAYSRNRYLGTDFGRTERQRKILSAVIDRLPGAVVKNPVGLMNGLLPNLTTNLTRGECLSLSLQAGKLLTYDLIQGSIPVEGSYSNASIRGMSVLQIDFDKNKDYIRSNIYGE